MGGGVETGPPLGGAGEIVYATRRFYVGARRGTHKFKNYTTRILRTSMTPGNKKGPPDVGIRNESPQEGQLSANYRALSFPDGVDSMKFPRKSGVVLHPTSLPGPYRYW